MGIITRILGSIALALALGACAADSAQDHLDSANEHLAAGDQRAAILELKNALQKDQNLGEARWLLGSTYLAAGDAAAAAKELQRALWLDWDRNEVVPAYASALVAAGDHAAAIKLPEEGLTDAAMAKLYAQKALARLALGENSDARELIDTALAIEPGNSTALLARAQLQLNLGEVESAAASLNTLIERAPDNPAAWFAMGELRGMRRDVDAAAEAYDKVLELDPGNLQALRKRTMLALDQGDVQTARQGARLLLRAEPKDPGANLVMGVVELQNQRYAEAIEHLNRADAIMEQYPLLAFFLGSAHLAQGNLEQADSYASRFYAIAPGSVRGRKLLASIRLQEENYTAVDDLLRPVIEHQPEDVGALKLMANALIHQGQTEEGITLLARVAQLEPDSAEAQISLGAGLLLGGKAGDAELYIETALELQPEYRQADLLLVLSHVQQANYEAALDKAGEFAQRNPNDTTSQNLIAWIHARSGDMEAAEQAYRQALETDPGDPGANHSLAQLALQEGDLDAAAAHYDTILRHHPDNLPAQLQRVLVDARRGDNAAVVARLEAAREDHPTALEPRLLLGRHYLSQGRPEKVSTAFVGLSEAQRRDPAVLQLTALAQLGERDHSQALFTLEQLTTSEPDSAPYHYLTAMAAAGTGDIQKAERELDRALELNPDHQGARVARAKLMLRLDREEAFREELEVLKEELPDNVDVMLMQAAAAGQEDDPQAAVAFARRAFETSPMTGTVLALGGYHTEAGDLPAARALYRGWLEKNPDDTAVRLKLAEDLMVAGEEATDAYRQTLQREPDNVVALNNLAWLLREKAPGEALEYARRAGELAPDNASTLDTLAVVEYLNGNLAQARRSIRRALESDPDHPSLLYHKAMIANAAGATDEARDTLRQLLQAGRNFPEAEEAETLLASLDN